MNNQAALPILQALADGRDPYSGAPLPPTSPYQQADTVRALHTALAAIAGSQAIDVNTPSKGAKATKATNAGKPWSKEEDEQLLAAFDAHEVIPAIARRHARSTLAIEARLARFERVPMPAGVRNVAPAPSAVPA